MKRILFKKYFLRMISRLFSLVKKISIKKYYLQIMLPIVLLISLVLLITGNTDLIVYILFFGILGMIGETIACWLWDVFYIEPFWEYKTQTIFKKYTSFLNLIPWGMGGFLYWLCFIFLPFNDLNFRDNWLSGSELINIILIFVVLQIVVLLLRFLFFGKRKLEFKKVTALNLLYFFIPFLAVLIYIGIFVTPWLIITLIIAGIVAFLTEYLFGKICHWKLGGRLWVYNYYDFDKGHISFLSIPLFIEGALYFLCTAEIIKIIIY